MNNDSKQPPQTTPTFFCRFFNNTGFCTTCGRLHDGTFQSA